MPQSIMVLHMPARRWFGKGPVMDHSLRVLWHDEGAMTTVEYALLLALIALAAITAWAGFGGHLRGSVERSGSRFGGVSPSAPPGG